VSFLRQVLEGLRKRRKAFAWLLALVLANVAIFVGVTHRLATKQERLEGERVRLEAELASKAGELSGLSETESRASRNAESVRRFWGDVVKDRLPGLTEAWDEIDHLASESNVVRGRTGYNREILDVGLEQIKATMPVEGSYFDLVRFINRLERSERFFLLEEVRLSQRETDEATLRLDCAIAFFLKSQERKEASGP
jgi:Tfp pilus assembly protein PilO